MWAHVHNFSIDSADLLVLYRVNWLDWKMFFCSHSLYSISWNICSNFSLNWQHFRSMQTWKDIEDKTKAKQKETTRKSISLKSFWIPFLIAKCIQLQNQDYWIRKTILRMLFRKCVFFFTVSVDKLECAVDICFDISLIFSSSVSTLWKFSICSQLDTKLRVFHFAIVLALKLSFSIAIFYMWINFFFGLLVIRDEHDGISVQFDKISNFEVKYGAHILKHLSHYVQFNFYFIVECVQWTTHTHTYINFNQIRFEKFFDCVVDV